MGVEVQDGQVRISGCHGFYGAYTYGVLPSQEAYNLVRGGKSVDRFLYPLHHMPRTTHVGLKEGGGVNAYL